MSHSKRSLTRFFGRSMTAFLVFASTVSMAVTMLGAEKKAGKPKSNEAAILKSIESYVEAYNRGDAAAVAAHWSDSGEWVSPSGERRTGRAAIEDALRELFAERAATTIEIRDPSVRMLADDVAVERGTVIVRTPGEESEPSTYVAMHVKRKEGWKLDSVYETAAPPEVVAASPLDELDWLVGEWSDADPENDVSVNIFWMKNRSFLNYSFQIAAPETDELAGTQVVGWDPAKGTIRSWLFDSDGGIGEGAWTRYGDRWVVKLQQTLPDGRRAVSTNVYTPVDADTIRWKSIGRKIDNEFLPNIDDVHLVRKRPAAAEVGSALPTK